MESSGHLLTFIKVCKMENWRFKGLERIGG